MFGEILIAGQRDDTFFSAKHAGLMQHRLFSHGGLFPPDAKQSITGDAGASWLVALSEDPFGSVSSFAVVSEVQSTLQFSCPSALCIILKDASPYRIT